VIVAVRRAEVDGPAGDSYDGATSRRSGGVMGIAYRLGEEWRSTVLEVFASPEWPPGRLNLTDLRTADFSELTIHDRAQIFEINARHVHKLVGMKSAAIGGANFDAARQFEREDRSSGLRLITFDDVGHACAWLGVDSHVVRPMLEELRSGLRSNA
jgi:hypothetical protein